MKYKLQSINLFEIGTDRGLNAGGVEIFRTRPYRHLGPLNLLYNRYCVSFSGVKMLGHGNDHLFPSIAKVKERVEIYLYSLSWPSMSCHKAKFTIYVTYFAVR
jgi:hypothetical protein